MPVSTYILSTFNHDFKPREDVFTGIEKDSERRGLKNTGAYTLTARNPEIINGFADHFGDSGFEYVYIPLIRHIGGSIYHDFKPREDVFTWIEKDSDRRGLKK